MFVALFLLIPISSTASACFVNYPSVIDVSVHPDSIDDLQEPILIGQTLFVKIQIGYAVTVPSRWLNGGLLARLWVFKQLIIPPVRIHLEEQNIPEGMTIGVTYPDVYLTDYSNNFVYTSADFVIIPNEGVQSGSYYVDLKAESPQIGRILSNSYTKRIFFEVAETP